ncbi:MAG: hypothetical protein J6M16_09980 [Clostridia bacterium]|nr:hypothetical protein [Clostridia bacterium]
MKSEMLKYNTAWRRLGDAIIKPGGEYGHSTIMNPNVIKLDNDIYLFYAGNNQHGRITIRLIIFKDGDFSKPEYKGIVVNNGEWGSFDGNWCVLPIVIKVKDKWHMYYSGHNGIGKGLAAFPGLGLATSDDLIHWEKYPDNPVLAPSGVPGAPDELGIAGGGIVTLPDGTLRWYYGGCPTVGSEHFLDQQKRMCIAASKDGIHWEKRGAILLRDPEKDYKDVGVTCGPCVYEDGVYKIWYPCIGTRWGFYSICYGESDDGLDWSVGECYADELAFGPRTRHLDMTEPYYTWDNQMAEYPCVFNKDGKRYMFYCGNGYGQGGLGVAVACNCRVYARGTKLFATFNGEKYDLEITAKVNGVELPKTKWSKPDSDCNVWRETETDGVTVRLIVVHTVEGIKVFCTNIASAADSKVELEVKFGNLARGKAFVYAAKGQSKSETIDIKL